MIFSFPFLAFCTPVTSDEATSCKMDPLNIVPSAIIRIYDGWGLEYRPELPGNLRGTGIGGATSCDAQHISKQFWERRMDTSATLAVGYDVSIDASKRLLSNARQIATTSSDLLVQLAVASSTEWSAQSSIKDSTAFADERGTVHLSMPISPPPPPPQPPPESTSLKTTLI